MTGKNTSRYGNSAFFYHLINWCTYLCYRFLRVFIKPKPSNKNINPLLITGLFRSGTTITSRIVNEMGFSAGPDHHLLKAIGSRKQLNPDGFLENHFCMELSMYLFYKTNSWGDAPPTKTNVEGLNLTESDDDQMVAFSLMKVHDDRISNINKLKVQLQGSASHAEKYFNANFTNRSFVKNPHIAVLFPYFKKIFSDSTILVVFRNPFDAVNSAKKVSPIANYALYNAYYEELCLEYKNGSRNVLFFSYDNLIVNPKTSVKQLSENIKGDLKQIPAYLIKKEITGISKINEVPKDTKAIYNFMLGNCINK